MPEGQVLEFAGVTKRFGGITAVTGLSARIEPGRVTGFLGPNGAGKTTSLRILLGLVRATDGTATIGGVPYAALDRPLQTVGAVLEASSFHPGRTAANHLRVYSAAAGLPRERVDEVLALVGLTEAAGRKIGGYSLGMRQRLGLAAALLGDPGVLVLDEPANGLDPEGIRWLRGFLRQLAAEGRTVLVSSHMLAEVQQTVDALVVISQGRMVFQGALEDLADATEYATAVDAADRTALGDALSAAGIPFEMLRSGATIRGHDTASIGRIAAEAGIALTSLQRKGPALEEVFLELVSGQRVHASASSDLADPTTAAPAASPPADATPDAADTDAETTGAADTDAETTDAEGTDAADTDAETTDAADERAEASVAAETLAETGGAPGAAVAMGAASAASVADDERPSAAFSVASTGVIDIVPASDDADDVPEPEAAPAADAPEQTTAPDVAEDADPDVEAIGGIDAELSEPDAPERPFDVYDKTESDRDADAFFAAFDDEAPAPDEGQASHDRDADSPQEGEHR